MPRRPTPPALHLSGIEAASLVKFAYFTEEAPAPGTLLFTAFRRNMPSGVKEFTVRNPVTFFYGIQQTGGLLNIQVRWINPDGVVARTSDQPQILGRDAQVRRREPECGQGVGDRRDGRGPPEHAPVQVRDPQRPDEQRKQHRESQRAVEIMRDHGRRANG